MTCAFLCDLVASIVSEPPDPPTDLLPFPPLYLKSYLSPALSLTDPKPVRMRRKTCAGGSVDADRTHALSGGALVRMSCVYVYVSAGMVLQGCIYMNNDGWRTGDLYRHVLLIVQTARHTDASAVLLQPRTVQTVPDDRSVVSPFSYQRRLMDSEGQWCCSGIIVWGMLETGRTTAEGVRGRTESLSVFLDGK